jgi:hypothetical protein
MAGGAVDQGGEHRHWHVLRNGRKVSGHEPKTKLRFSKSNFADRECAGFAKFESPLRN